MSDNIALKASFDAIVEDIKAKFVKAPAVPVQSWQSTQAPQPMPELLNYSFTLDLHGVRNIQDYQKAIKPNLPWADNHFRMERISGEPVNPGSTWREWPYARSADKHRREGEEDPQFDHSYAERYWPKYAGKTVGGRLTPDDELNPIFGIRSQYGDLLDLLTLLGLDPLTRQAYLPVWFPEDLYGAAIEGRRVPCTLGYHFIRRDDKLHVVYPMRSCDFIRHFRDDVYLTIRLLLYVLDMLQFRKPELWNGVQPGTFTMHITSLHMFLSDRETLLRGMAE